MLVIHRVTSAFQHGRSRREVRNYVDKALSGRGADAARLSTPVSPYRHTLSLILSPKTAWGCNEHWEREMPTRTSPATSRGEGFRNRWRIAFLHAPSPPLTKPQAEGVFRANRRPRLCRAEGADGLGNSAHGSAMQRGLAFQKSPRVPRALGPDFQPGELAFHVLERKRWA
jgi:hypothetical protein